jgi:hypothetical protein
MGKIVNVVIVDSTRPVEQKGFKSVLIANFQTEDVPLQKITSVEGLTPGGPLYENASAFFANGGTECYVAAKDCPTAAEAVAYYMELIEQADFYGFIPLLSYSATDPLELFVEELTTAVEGTEKLMIAEIMATKDDVILIAESTASDRLAVYGNADLLTPGAYGGGIAGMGFKYDEGSLTWGNQVITGVVPSGYTLAEETELLDANANYITEEKGFIMTQMGRTTSGSNIDITRSKDYLKNRLEETLTAVLVNNKKIPFTTQGIAMISGAMDQVGNAAVASGMLVSFLSITPKVSDVPTEDKANRVLRGVKFIATLAGAIETIEVELEVRL